MLKEFQCSICTILDNFCSAIIEHTNQVIFLEDDDVAAVQNGCLTIHRIKRTLDESATREVTTIKMEIQQIMKGQLLIQIYQVILIFSHFYIDKLIQGLKITCIFKLYLMSKLI